MVPPEPGSARSGTVDPGVRWKRWPCPKCGYTGRRFAVLCPECEARPWPAPLEGAETLLKPGVHLEVRGRRPLFLEHRFSTSLGFLGLLTRRLFGGADWLGVDGREWICERVGPLGQAWILLEEDRILAAAEGKGSWAGLFGLSWRIWYGQHEYTFARTGLAPHGFVVAVEDGPEILRIRGGVFNPLRSVEVVSELSLPTLLLASFLACGARQSEGG